MFIHLLTPVLKPLSYLDPGSGSFIIQIVIAALLGLGVTTRLYWSKIKGIFSKSAPGEKQTPVEKDNEE